MVTLQHDATHNQLLTVLSFGTPTVHLHNPPSYQRGMRVQHLQKPTCQRMAQRPYKRAWLERVEIHHRIGHNHSASLFIHATDLRVLGFVKAAEEL